VTGSRDLAQPGQRVVVVGPCASGKTTLAIRLRECGIDARVCGQEHSAIRNLWLRMEPDILVALALDLETLRERRSPRWPKRLYDVQMERLRDAYAAANVVIDTSSTSPDDMVARVLALMAPGTVN
jgi:hypothetical protein